KTGNPYVIGVQYAEHHVVDKHTLESIPITSERASADGRRTRVRLDQVAQIDRIQGPVEVYHHDLDRVSQILVSVGDQDLAGVAAEIERIVAEFPLKNALDLLAMWAPDKKGALENNETFKEKLEAYLREGQKPEQLHVQRQAIIHEFGVDPEPL